MSKIADIYSQRTKVINWNLVGDLLSTACFTILSIAAWWIFIDFLMSINISPSI